MINRRLSCVYTCYCAGIISSQVQSLLHATSHYCTPPVISTEGFDRLLGRPCSRAGQTSFTRLEALTTCKIQVLVLRRFSRAASPIGGTGSTNSTTLRTKMSLKRACPPPGVLALCHQDGQGLLADDPTCRMDRYDPGKSFSRVQCR